MSDQPKSNPPPGVKKAPSNKSPIASLRSAAEKAIRPFTKRDYSVSNGIAATLIDPNFVCSPGQISRDKPRAEAPQEVPGTTDDRLHNGEQLLRTAGEETVVQLNVQESPTHSTSSSTTTSATLSASAGVVHARFAPIQPATQQPYQSTALENVAKPMFHATLPRLGGHFKSTPQLAFALRLLPKKSPSTPPIRGLPGIVAYDMQETVLNEDEEEWIKAIRNDSIEQDYVRWLSTQVVAEFLRTQHKNSATIKEVVLLGASLDCEDYRSVLSSLIAQLERDPFLDSDLLQAVVQLIQDGSPGDLIDDDLVRILRVLRQRLKDTYKPLGDKEHAATDPVFLLTTTISRVLDAMVEGNVKGLHRTEDHKPLLDILAELKESSDPFLKFQAAYAWQALQYVGDDESPLHAVLRFGGGVTMGALGAASVFKFDPENLVKGLQQLGQAADQAFDVAKSMAEGAQAFRAGGEGVVDSMLKGFRSGFKRAWYPALQGARTFVREGQLAAFHQVVFDKACNREPEFQQGVCQLLGEIALDPIWTTEIRQGAVELLSELFRNGGNWSSDTGVKKAILAIIRHITEHTEEIIKSHAAELLKSLPVSSPASEPPRSYPLMPRLPLPAASPLLSKALKIPSDEYKIHRLKLQRLKEYTQTVYVPPQVRSIVRKPEEDEDGERDRPTARSVAISRRAVPQSEDEISAERFSLVDKVKEFLVSDRQVFLVMGDSGAGKSTFNRYLEKDLWRMYKQGDSIPLFINLPAMEKPQKELISEHLRASGFTEDEVQYLKESRQFIVVCDSYDESQLNINLHSTNSFNLPGQWNTKMIISCRSTYLGKEYRHLFQPQPLDRYDSKTPHLLQEVIIVPFSCAQIEIYVEQFVQETEVHELFGGRPVWGAEEYLGKLKAIPNLMGLVTNPFLLVMALRTLPGMLHGVQDLTELVVSRTTLYRAFVKQWLENGEERLRGLKLAKDEMAHLKELSEAGFVKIASKFLKDLATAIFREQDGNPIVRYLHYDDKATWKADFFGPAMEATLLRDASPLTRSGDIYRFIHRSLLEYFYSFEEHEIHQHRIKSLQRYTARQHSLYISPQAKVNPRDLEEESRPLMTTVQEFLQSKRQVFLLLGDGGFGEISFSEYLEYDLLKSYRPCDPITLMINLPTNAGLEQDLISSYLRKRNFSDDVIQALKQHREFILICDAYDKSRLTANLHTLNSFNRIGHWSVKKMIVNYRRAEYDRDYHLLFSQESASANTEQLFEAVTIVPFTEDQTRLYIEQYVHRMSSDSDSSVRAIWRVERYLSELGSMASLMEMASSSCILPVLLQILPAVLRADSNLCNPKHAFLGILDEFVERWIDMNRRRICDRYMSPREFEEFLDLMEAGFITEARFFHTQLADAIFEYQDGLLVVEYPYLGSFTLHGQGAWAKGFFGDGVINRFMYECGLLVCSRNQYQFLHHSLLSYFYSCRFCDPQSFRADEDGEDNEDDQEEYSFADNEFTVEHPLNKRSLVGESMVLQFLAGRVEQFPMFKVLLFVAVEESKTNAGVAVAAANAITILVKAEEQFDNVDLTGIRIPGADLTGTSLGPDRLQGADLTGATLPSSFTQ